MGLIDIDAGSLVAGIGKIAGDLITTDKERLELALKAQELSQENDKGQIEVNKIEAASTNWFIAGWRPGLGWVGVAACSMNWLVIPTVSMIAQMFGKELPLTLLDFSQIWPLLATLLGNSALRTYEKKTSSEANR